MTHLPMQPANHGHSLSSHGLARVAPLALSMAWALGVAAGCTDATGSEDVASVREAIESENGLSTNGLSTNGLSTNGLSTNGLSTNGLSTNGLSTNGLSTNGLSTNGLSTNGLSTNGFSAWFDSNSEAYSSRVMQYVVRCAVAEGETRSFVSSAGVSYTWTGLFGLAPSWSAGGAIPASEQQLVSACLAAHANKFGLHVDISVRGRMADGSLLPVTKKEKKSFKFAESCFFGNLFEDDGVYAAPIGSIPTDGHHVQSSPRACGVVEPWDTEDCAPFLPRLSGSCADYCTGWSSSKGTFESCTLAGTVYKPLTTHMDEDDLFECGDGVCQVTEVPYSTSSHAGCGDCGTVP